MNNNRISIISGGQSGTDRAALDFALQHRIPCGGWCPQGRWAEDGRISQKYPLKETSSKDPAERTKKNIDDSDGTLILCQQQADEGTRLAISYSNEKQKPVIMITKDVAFPKKIFLEWIENNDIQKLNIAGPRESNAPGTYDFAYQMITKLLIGFF